MNVTRLKSVCFLLCACSGFIYLCTAAPSHREPLQAICENDLPSLKQYLQNEGDPNARSGRENTLLMYATAYGTIDAMKLLLAHHADPNLKNAFDATALMWSVPDAAKVSLLLSKGADADARTKSGKTALLLAAMQPNTENSVNILAAHHADPSVIDGFGTSLLHAGSDGRNVAAVRLGLASHLDVNAKLRNGSTPLMSAAADGSAEIVKLLLDAGADPNAVSAPPGLKVKNGTITLGRFTPLILAAPYSSPEVIELLLKRGARVDPVDARGMTALHAAVSSESQNPETVRLLLANGADPKFKNADGQSAQDWAAKFARPDILKLLAYTPTQQKPSGAGLPSSNHDAADAFARGRNAMETSTKSFFQASGCVGCHSQNITGMLAGAAREHRLAMDPQAAAERIANVKASWAPQAEGLLVREDPPGGADMVVYSLLGLAGDGYKPDLTTAAMARNVAVQQMPDGSWHRGGIARVPVEDSDIALTAAAIRSLAVFEGGGTHAEYAARIRRAQIWLTHAIPHYAEEQNMRLLGLKWSGAPAQSVAEAARSLAAKQRSSGGWGQNDFLPEDAYATGQALFALSETGMAMNDAVFQKGTAYLLRTQAADGTWHVTSRAVKFQPYFQSGFPYSHDQWISSMGTGWATMALASVAKP